MPSGTSVTNRPDGTCPTLSSALSSTTGACRLLAERRQRPRLGTVLACASLDRERPLVESEHADLLTPVGVLTSAPKGCDVRVTALAGESPLSRLWVVCRIAAM